MAPEPTHPRLYSAHLSSLEEGTPASYRIHRPLSFFTNLVMESTTWSLKLPTHASTVPQVPSWISVKPQASC